MDFRTELSLEPSSESVAQHASIFTIGSCFADVIGSFLSNNKFSVANNPFGTSYNPISIHKILKYIAEQTVPADETYISSQGIFKNFDFHSALAATDKSKLSAMIADRLAENHRLLATSGWLLVTYGTAWVYERKENGTIVNNCHKIPADLFHKRLIDVSEIIESFRHLQTMLTGLNPKIKTIVTVSPVRHLKDTLELNSVSKSILRLACHQIAHAFPNVEYFPAYEIMMDDLRDYRFYQSDLIHPTPMAEQYIWEKFMDRYFTEETKSFIRKWAAIQNAINHRPFHSGSKAHQQFLQDTLEKLLALEESVDVSKEIADVKQRLEKK